MSAPIATISASSPQPAVRPTGVTVLGVLAIIVGVLASIVALAVLVFSAALGASSMVSETDLLGVFGVLGAMAGVAVLLWAAFHFAVAYGIFNRQRWAWYASVILAAFQMMQGLLSFLAFDIFSALVNLGIGGFIAWYLLSPPVQAWFGVSHNTPWKYDRRIA